MGDHQRIGGPLVSLLQGWAKARLCRADHSCGMPSEIPHHEKAGEINHAGNQLL
jgi:hypothetical protein